MRREAERELTVNVELAVEDTTVASPHSGWQWMQSSVLPQLTRTGVVQSTEYRLQHIFRASYREGVGLVI